MKQCKLIVKESSVAYGLVSLRSPKNTMGVREVLTGAGFNPDDEVVVILEKDLQELLERAGEQS